MVERNARHALEKEVAKLAQRVRSRSRSRSKGAAEPDPESPPDPQAMVRKAVEAEASGILSTIIEGNACSDPFTNELERLGIPPASCPTWHQLEEMRIRAPEAAAVCSVALSQHGLKLFSPVMSLGDLTHESELCVRNSSVVLQGDLPTLIATVKVRARLKNADNGVVCVMVVNVTPHGDAHLQLKKLSKIWG